MAEESETAVWTDETDAFDRIVSISTTLSQPRTAAHIADEALVNEESAQEYLNQLVDLNTLQRDDRTEQTLYSPDPLYTRMVTLRKLLDEYGREEMEDLRGELQDELETLDGQERDLAAYRLGLVEEAIRICK